MTRPEVVRTAMMALESVSVMWRPCVAVLACCVFCGLGCGVHGVHRVQFETFGAGSSEGEAGAVRLRGLRTALLDGGGVAGAEAEAPCRGCCGCCGCIGCWCWVA